MRVATSIFLCACACGPLIIPNLEVMVEGPGKVTSADGSIDCPTRCLTSLTPAQPVDLRAEPDEGAIFVRWSIPACGGTSTCRASFDAETKLTAVFAPGDRVLTATVTGAGRGSIISGDGSISCGSRCDARFANGTNVRLTAMPEADSELGAWSGACEGTTGPTCDLRMDADRNVAARFDRARFSVTVMIGGTGGSRGHVTSAGGEIDCPSVQCASAFESGAHVELTATASAGARFDGWSGGGCGAGARCMITVGGREAVTAIFTDITVPLHVARDGSGGGTVTSTPLGISCGTACDAKFLPGAEVMLIAAPDASSRFHGWEGACASFGRTPSCVLTLDAAQSARAIFHENVVKSVAFGVVHTCVLIDPDVVRCFGSNEYGQLGYGDAQNRGDGTGPAANAADVSLGSVSDIGGGHWHSCAVVNGEAYCWGRNDYGQLGAGDSGLGRNPSPRGPLDFGGALVTDVEGGTWHTCAIVEGAVRCWGNGMHGALGYGDMMMRTRPGPALTIFGAGTVQQLAVGTVHNCVLLSPGTVRCWGNNDFGQLGYGDMSPRGTSAGTVGDVDFGGELVQQIAIGALHTCALLMNGRVRCWGRNDEGQLGLGDTERRGEEMTDIPIMEDVPLPDDAVEVASGDNHSCARLVDGRVYCWGWNFAGQLGYGDTTTRGDGIGPAAGEASLMLGLSVDSILARVMDMTCAIVNGGALTCWGQGGSGQLGYGNTLDRGDGMGPAAGAVLVPIF